MEWPLILPIRQSSRKGLRFEPAICLITSLPHLQKVKYILCNPKQVNGELHHHAHLPLAKKAYLIGAVLKASKIFNVGHNPEGWEDKNWGMSRMWSAFEKVLIPEVNPKWATIIFQIYKVDDVTVNEESLGSKAMGYTWGVSKVCCKSHQLRTKSHYSSCFCMIASRSYKQLSHCCNIT